MTVVVETRGLTKEFRGGRGVRNINLQVRQGQVFGFLGPNGAGKSTFVKMLVGLLRPTSGEASVLGLPAGDLEVRKRVGYLPELFRYQDWLTPLEVLAFHARLCRLEASYAQKRIHQVLQEVGLSGRERDKVRSYSKGMQQRLGIACALLPEPEVLFLDEPASALDPVGRHEVRELLRRLCREGMTVFLNTHLLEDVENICSEVALLIDGTIHANGSVEEILHPEPVWDFTVGGWSNDVAQDLISPPGWELSLKARELGESGQARLAVKLQSALQVAWFNEQLVQSGVSVYAIEPRRNRLESWFLTLTESRGGESS